NSPNSSRHGDHMRQRIQQRHVFSDADPNQRALQRREPFPAALRMSSILQYRQVKSAEIAILRSCIKAIRLSPLTMERLKTLCENDEPNVKFVKPTLDVPTRWHSSADMSERARCLRKPLTILINDMQESAKEDENLQ
ncbi:hypothetical protein ROZALSC1DRAFT_24412, partial [Rozella allomycis CSF55]